MTPFELIIAILAYIFVGVYIEQHEVDITAPAKRIVSILSWPVWMLVALFDWKD